MKLNRFEFGLMNNMVRAASQRWIETPLLIGGNGALAGQHVMEIGCGRGVGIEILLELGAIGVTAFDIDPRMVGLAEERVARYGPCVRVFVGDAQAVDAPDASQDAVVDFGILHHVPDWQHALFEVSRVLRPGGTFYFEDILQGITRTWPMSTLFDHPQTTQFTAAQLRAGLEIAGLRVTRWRQVLEWGVMGQAVK